MTTTFSSLYIKACNLSVYHVFCEVGLISEIYHSGKLTIHNVHDMHDDINKNFGLLADILISHGNTQYNWVAVLDRQLLSFVSPITKRFKHSETLKILGALNDVTNNSKVFEPIMREMSAKSGIRRQLVQYITSAQNVRNFQTMSGVFHSICLRAIVKNPQATLSMLV